MAQVIPDSSIYFQQKPLDLLSGVQRGLQMRDKMDERNQRQAEQQRLAQQRGYEEQIQNAYGQSVVQNPDGTSSFDNQAFQNNLAALTGKNPLAGQKMQEFGLGLQQREREQQKFEAEQRSRGFDDQVKRAQAKKLGEETNQLRMKPTARKEIKQNQALAAGFGRRIEQAENAMKALSEAGYNPASISAGVGRMMPNIARSKEAQMQEQAERNFLNAVLRRESGAAIAPHEFESAEMQYFPRVGDTPEVLAQKAANRAQAMSMFKAEAAHAWDAIPLETPNRNPLKQRPTDPPIGKTQDGYKYLGGDPSDQRNWEKI